MKRLTKQDILDITKNKYFLLPRTIGKEMSTKIINELLEYKNIEDELGIDLVVLYKALTNGVWIKNELRQIHHTNVYLHNLILSPSSAKNDFCFITPDNVLLLFDRIKHDWALTKEELE